MAMPTKCINFAVCSSFMSVCTYITLCIYSSVCLGCLEFRACVFYSGIFHCVCACSPDVFVCQSSSQDSGPPASAVSP